MPMMCIDPDNPDENQLLGEHGVDCVYYVLMIVNST